MIGVSRDANTNHISYPNVEGNGQYLYSNGLYLGLTKDIRYHRATSGAMRIDSIYLDYKNAHDGPIQDTDRFYPLNRDYLSLRQNLLGIGLQRRFFPAVASRLRPYVGFGAGLYYLQTQLHFYGTDYTLVSYNADDTANYTVSSHDHTETHGGFSAGGKLMIGIQDKAGPFAQFDLSIIPKASSQRIRDVPGDTKNDYGIGIRAGYQF